MRSLRFVTAVYLLSSVQLAPQPQKAPEVGKSKITRQNQKPDEVQPDSRTGRPPVAQSKQPAATNTNTNTETHGHQEEKKDPDWWIIFLTAGLLVVGALQVWVMIRQTAIVDKSLLETQKATELTRQSLVLSQRPRITVRNVEISSDPELLYQRHAGMEGEPIGGSIFVVNSGSTEGRATAICCGIFRGALPMVPPYPEERIVDIKLPPGQGIRWPFETIPPQASEMKEWRELSERSGGVYVLGLVTYQDDIGTIRSTAFSRRWNPAANRFFTVDDPDYEHAE